MTTVTAQVSLADKLRFLGAPASYGSPAVSVEVIETHMSYVFLAGDRILIARDPNGFRPLAMGQLEVSGGKVSTVFASETCAFDLIQAQFVRDVEPGEIVIIEERFGVRITDFREEG